MQQEGIIQEKYVVIQEEIGSRMGVEFTGTEYKNEWPFFFKKRKAY